MAYAIESGGTSLCRAREALNQSFPSKRVNHEALGKARAWITAFGSRQIVPCAVLSGVFNPSNLDSAQAEGLTIIWSHRLQDLAAHVSNDGRVTGGQ